MAKTNNKSDIKRNGAKVKTVTNKKNNNVKGKKTNTPKKKIVVDDEIKKEIKEVELIKKPTKKKNVNSQIEKNELTKEERAALIKERNRKKYENKQKRYKQNVKQNQNHKKKVVVPDQVVVDKNKDINNEDNLVKKNKDKIDKSKEERKKKRRSNKKSLHLTQTFVNLKNMGVNTINTVKEKTNDQNIPLGKTSEDKKKRLRRTIKEAIAYSIILTIINVLLILIFDYFNFLRLFDIKALNVVITIVISLIFNFFITFMIDYFATKIWLKVKNKKEDGDSDGNSGVIEGEHKEDIENKEGE